MINSIFLDRYLNQMRAGLSESEFNATGQSMSQEQVLALALEVLQ